MRVISAYLLAVLGGNSSPSADDIKKILDSVGIDGPEDRIDAFLKEVDGKDIAEVVAGGLSKLASVPSGGAAVAAPAAGGGGGGGAAAAGGEAKKEEKKEESEEEEDDDMGFSLFD